MLIKSSMESLELAYDAVNMVYKNLLNQPGQMYNKWFIKNGYGQDNAYIMAEHTDYSVRMFFTFTDTGFIYVEGYFTNGSSYDRKNITSWRFDNDEYPFEETTNHVKQVLDNFFDEGINALRGEEVYNSRKSIKSATSKELKEAIAGLNDIEDEFALVDYVKKILKKNGMSNKVEAFCDETDKADTPEELGKVAEKYIHMAIKSSRKPIKSGYMVTCEDEDGRKMYWNPTDSIWYFSQPNGYVYNSYPEAEEGMYEAEEYRKRDAYAPVGTPCGIIEVTSSRKPIKSSADNLPSEVYYMVVQGAKMYYSTDYDKVAEMVQKINSEPGPRVYGPYTEDDPDEIRELYEVGYLSNSRKPVKSSTTWVAGKSENGNKSFYCEDGKFYAEEDYGRPSIKVFNNKDDAEKIAKRSKSGFIQVLDEYDD